MEVEFGKKSSYAIKNLNTSKALMISVQPKSDQKTPALTGFQVKVSGEGLDHPVECSFAYLTHLCVVEAPPSEVTVEVKCSEAKCKQGLVLSQRALIDTGVADKPYVHHLKHPGAILKLQERPFNSIMEIYSEVDHSPEAARSIIVYSNVHIFTL